MNPLLEQAASYIKAGDTEKGKQLLIEVIKHDPNDENAWLWMSRCVRTVEQKRECFDRVLKINPQNPHALEGLRRLDAANNNLVGQRPHQTAASKSSIKKQNNTLLIIGGIVALGLTLVCAFVIILINPLSKLQTLPALAPSSTYTLFPTDKPVSTSTIMPTFTPTETKTPTITPTSSITNTPFPTYTATFTSTPIPLTNLAKRAKQVAISRGFVSDATSCGQDSSCQAYISQDPYMVLVIKNNGLIIVTIWDETHSVFNYAQPPGATAPYDLEIKWYWDTLDEIYDSFSPYFGITATGVMDGTMKLGHFSLQTDHLYTVDGSLSTNQKMILTITPP